MRRQTEILSCVFAAGLLAASLALTQTTPTTPATQSTQTTATPQNVQPQQTPAPQNPYFEDTDNLNKMAIALKQQVDKSSKDQLSLIVVHKADEIEKLAHALKLRMRNDGGAK
jgi:hypothetical protein